MCSFHDLVRRYLDRYPHESDRLTRISALMDEFEHPSDLIARTNFVGHVTASGFVLTPDRQHILLVMHQALGMFLQPGGHLDGQDISPLAGAIREVREETGLVALTALASGDDHDIPFDIDSHHIPPNARKGEPEHWHHDFRYVFVCEDAASMQLATDEVADARWIPVDELERYPTFERVGMKIREFVREAR